MKLNTFAQFLFVILFINSVNAQSRFEVLKIDTSDMETMNIIYLKKKTFLNNKIYRIMTNKKDTVIEGQEKIKIGDVLKLKLINSTVDIDLKSTPLPKDNENSFFYKDSYEGKKVNVDYYSEDIIDLYYVAK